jgi:hypothetical protein
MVLQGNVMYSFLIDSENFVTHSKFLENKDNPIFVSYPRTGAHWIMTCLENYFNRPVLYDSYVNNEVDVEKVLLLHTHDGETGYPCFRPALSIKWPNVIVLHRDPVDTVFSGLSLRGLHEDRESIMEEAVNYKNFIDKWLRFEDFTKRKLIVKYDDLKNDFVGEFSRIVRYFNRRTNKKKIMKLQKTVTRELIRNKYPHTINAMPDYDSLRKDFRNKFSGLILEIVDNA